jgi:hypothetical protein
VKQGYTTDPYGRLKDEASCMLRNELIVHFITVSKAAWEKYIFHKMRLYLLSGEVFGLTVEEALPRVLNILKNKKLKVLQLQPRIAKIVQCYR